MNNLNNSGRRLPAAAAVVMAVLAVACEQPEPVDVVRPVKMLELSASQPAEPLEYPGRIAATQDVEIAFEVGGLIVEYPVAQGQFVQRGQLLARLDARDFEAALDARQAERNVSLADYRRYQDLYAADAASLQELEVSRRRFEVADAQIRTAEKAVEDAQLLPRSPVGSHEHWSTSFRVWAPASRFSSFRTSPTRWM